MFRKISLFLLLSLSITFAFSQKRDDILGKWLNASGEGQIEIYKKGEKYFGKLAWLKNPNDDRGKPKMDEKNPTASLKNKSLLGLEILKNFDFDEDEWTDGTIYDPKTGKTYSCNMSIKSNGQLNIRGYVGISIIGRSESWKRVK